MRILLDTNIWVSAFLSPSDDDVACGTAVAADAQYLATRDDDLKRDPKLMQALRTLGVEVLTVSVLESRIGPAAG
jgi:predicted nucleic acid-binding protein